MNEKQLSEFANYEVYVREGKETKILCICKESSVATAIAKSLAMRTKEPNVKIYMTCCPKPEPYTFVPGGGWYDCYWRDEEGKLRSGGLG